MVESQPATNLSRRVPLVPVGAGADEDFRLAAHEDRELDGVAQGVIEQEGVRPGLAVAAAAEMVAGAPWWVSHGR
jgi:hypothetical protein